MPFFQPRHSFKGDGFRFPKAYGADVFQCARPVEEEANEVFRPVSVLPEFLMVMPCCRLRALPLPRLREEEGGRKQALYTLKFP